MSEGGDSVGIRYTLHRQASPVDKSIDGCCKLWIAIDDCCDGGIVDLNEFDILFRRHHHRADGPPEQSCLAKSSAGTNLFHQLPGAAIVRQPRYAHARG